ncbi:ImmA/IrrE family metallo-endopeptidase [Nocardia camponoti]|uniref:IrrE N-terminal-like domain-containing protein n=1 Tax=Nocardia camponoti TaxID=1616106 RepID=A0A917QCU8_9NOCA|nr:ImmA/IrrE family metallo-endopeptidase [Nocardia camponoti]GGK44566.1 hypothetical protein GCM10011591_15230 [Nocardia camponoti]
MNSEAQGQAAAVRFRDEHRMGAHPLGDLVSIIEQAMGIDVAILDADADEHGLTVRDPVRDAVFIGVARTRRPMRQRSTLAHELAHVLFEDWTEAQPAGWSERTPTEVRADAFARHLLVPIQGLREFLGSRTSVGQSTLSEVVQRFLVSPQLAAIALHQAGYINADTKHEWMSLTAPQLAGRFGWSDHYHALQADSHQRRAPQRLLARAIAGYEQGVVSAQTVATLRGVTLAEAEADLQQAGVTPLRPDIVWVDTAQLPEVQIDLNALDQALDTPDDATDNHRAEGHHAG